MSTKNRARPPLHRLVILSTFCLLAAGSAVAKPTITNLGVLSGGSLSYSFAYGISADGLVVTGQSSSSAGARAFRWTAAGGMKTIGVLPGFTDSSNGAALSADGSVITGTSYGSGGSLSRGFRWTAAGGIKTIGVLGTGSGSNGAAISADGSVIVGGSYANGFNGPAAIRWTAATGMKSLGSPGKSASGVSSDGLVMAGYSQSQSADGFRMDAFRWTAAGGFQYLGLLPAEGFTEPNALALSADGLTAAGYSRNPSAEITHAFRWTAGTGMQDLGTLEGSTYSLAFALSGDGSVAGGSSVLPAGERAFLWTPTLGMVDLNSYLPALGADLTGWKLGAVRGISADGSAITGYGAFNGASRAFLIQGLTALNAQGPSAPLLTTFQNPAPADSALFGTAVAALGSDRVLIGAEGAGAAYLLSTGGALLTTFHNPAPGTASHFGVSVAAVGGDKVIIGAHQDSTGAAGAGAAYLFSTDGALLKTFSNPKPAAGEAFGWSVAAAGNDRVLIGARFDDAGAGAAYLFDTDGTLLKGFENPAPAVAGNFGVSVAAAGNDRVLIGAVGSPAPRNGGVVYLFVTDGTLVTTFNNPTPGAFDYFGWSVAAVGRDCVLIGAYQDYSGNSRAGTAHLFSTTGTLLNTFTNPTPAAGDAFGVSVAAVGSDRVLIGALGDDTGATNAGAAYLFDLPYPPLSIGRNGDTISLSWLSSETGLILQQSDQLSLAAPWSNTPEPVAINALTNLVQQSVASGVSRRFFRLIRR